MSVPSLYGRYILISPVKDEEKFVEVTIQAVLKQTVRPERWIIVDDGSRDKTSQIVERYARENEWIKVLRIDGAAVRLPGPGVIRAFNAGYQLIGDTDFDFLVKLDCDLDFSDDYFEQLLRKFQGDKTLGIASGLCVEKSRDGWHPSSGPEYHAFGASKMVRAKCFNEIGGFLPSRGWDTIDEIRAQMAGWRTCHVKELPLYHLKPEGSGMGFMRTHMMHGEIFYLTGGGAVFFLLKVGHRMLFGKPVLLGGWAMFYGYLRARVFKNKKLVTKAEAQFYRHTLNDRIWHGFVRVFIRNRDKKTMLGVN